jgi:hypothetical protein
MGSIPELPTGHAEVQHLTAVPVPSAGELLESIKIDFASASLTPALGGQP